MRCALAAFRPRPPFAVRPWSALAPLRTLPPEAFTHTRRAAGAPRPQTKPAKHVGPRKRANKVMMALREEMKAELQARQEMALPAFRVGDKVRVSFLHATSEEKADDYEGVILAHVKRGADASILLRGLKQGGVYEARIPLFSPLLKGMEVLVPAAIHKGRKRGKRVRRAKLYYLRERDPATFL